MSTAEFSTFKLLLPLALLPGLFGAAVTAVAQQPTQAQISAIRQSCRGDYGSVCAGVPTGGRAALQCLQQHLAGLSPDCQTAVAATEGAGASHASAPPPGSPPPSGMGAAAAQPIEAPPALSRRQEFALVRHQCGGDFGAYCSDVRFGGGRILACLMNNAARVSPDCKGALADLRASQ